MTQSDILAMPADDYMNEAQLAFFECLLREKLAETVASIESARKTIADLGVAPDEVDQASIEEERVALSRSLERLNQQVQSIKHSLKSISDESYGYCEETGEEIGLQRLLAQPTARFSVAAQSQKELIARHYLAA
ncbi:TraR/DksA family transcriptional regulator (plasmid) [Pseudomonas aeruginosa]|jgi:DnaK suppressor protein|uniref:TraR/DksA family transcriptional regulator n=1 Tax=Pseudomonas aeruginosa TaxID=287 RepID=UPI0021C127A3|nr:TraR/DksA family transcriptional regulator [Pseudomonas aeruginosa]UXH55898.1 TraR/DksA family transcriptional regulator [Pseudomonas aeruginosa]UXH68942.1 TraR/DksA family transcriptional regulator [Pseudomonas aeruginosa]